MTDKLSIVVLMAGKSERLTIDGVPKPFLQIGEKYLFQYSVEKNLKCIKEEFNLYFVINEKLFNMNGINLITTIFPESKVIKLNQDTNGALESLFLSLRDLNCSRLLVLDCDLIIDSHDFLMDIQKNPLSPRLCIFESDIDIYSFAQIEKNEVKKVKEKIVISNKAVAGLYYFGSSNYHLEEINNYLKSNKTENEYYISHYFNHIIQEDRQVFFTICENHRSFGTLKEYESYLKTKVKILKNIL